MKKITSKIFAVVLLACIGLTACKKLSSYDYPSASASAYEVIKADLNFSYFRTIIDRAGLAETLSSGDYTVFAPTNNAFIASGYPLATLVVLPPEALATIVKNHIINGKVDVKTTNGAQASASGRQILIQSSGGAYYADGGDITNPDQATSNGYLNVINKVLISKPTILEALNTYNNTTVNSQFTYLAAAITRASTGSTNFTALLSGTEPYTFFAPNNGAFNDAGYASIAAVQAANPDVLGNVLKYHLIQGSKLVPAFDSVAVKSYNGTDIYFDRSSNTSRTTLAYANGIIFGNTGSANIMANNGVVHSVGRFLSAPITTTTLDRIQSDPTLSMFYAMIVRASTADPAMNFQTMLSGTKSSYTVFAVNNTGLIAAGYANVAAINAETPAVLAKILKLHILPKRINNISIADNGTVQSLLKTTDPAGNEVTASLMFTTQPVAVFKIKGASNTVSVNVSPANITTTNGLLNVIGTVLTP